MVPGPVTCRTKQEHTNGSTQTQQVQLLSNHKAVVQDATVTISGNQLEGNVGSKIKDIPVAVTTISPTYQAQNIAVKTSNNGDFETTLNLDEVGTHDVIVSYDGKSIGKFSQQVTEEGVREYAGVDILELRLSLLETLERILEIIFGK